jgi:hypothetical protein
MSASRAQDRNKYPSTNSDKTDATVYIDIAPRWSTRHLTTATTFLHFILLVEIYSRRPFLRGIPEKSTDAVIVVV